MKRQDALDASAKALRNFEMSGRITLEWERVPNSQKRKWWAKAAVMLEAINYVADGE